MNRFYVNPSCIDKQHITISDPDDVHHLIHVLRMKTGEELSISDGTGKGYIARISSLSKQKVVLSILKTIALRVKAGVSVHLTMAIAVARNVPFEDIVNKCTQLGVDTIIPLFTQRTLVRKEVFEKRQERMLRVMFAAAKQSGVLKLPQLCEPSDLAMVLRSAKDYDLCLLPHLSHEALSIKKAIQGELSSFSKQRDVRILVLIGPEGDFTSREIEGAVKSGCVSISLGPSVMRVDTAAIAVASFIKLMFLP